MIEYPKDFIKKLKEILPENSALHEAAFRGEYMVGDMLCKIILKGCDEPLKNKVRHLVSEWTSLKEVIGATVRGWMETGGGSGSFCFPK